MARERLDKMLAGRGAGSRREVTGMIRGGLVTVNGVPCRDPAQKVDPDADTVCLGGCALRTRRERYVMLNKPGGVITATEDVAQETVLDLLPAAERRGLFPVGRLDKDTEGLLLLTDDGPMGHALTAPRRHVDKLYLAHITGTLRPDAAAQFEAGIVLEDGTVCRPAKLCVLEKPPDDGLTAVEITLREGKFHQVKRMVAAMGGRVVWLKRLSMGPLTLDPELAPGAWRELTDSEIEALRHAIEP